MLAAGAAVETAGCLVLPQNLACRHQHSQHRQSGSEHIHYTSADRIASLSDWLSHGCQPASPARTAQKMLARLYTTTSAIPGDCPRPAGLPTRCKLRASALDWNHPCTSPSLSCKLCAYDWQANWPVRHGSIVPPLLHDSTIHLQCDTQEGLQRLAGSVLPYSTG